MAKKKTIMVSFVLDETGSMSSVRDSTISGFNEYVQTLKENKDQSVIMTLTKFNSAKVEIVYENKPISKVPDLNVDTYIPAGLTPLYDAVGQAIRKAEKDCKGKEVLFVIMTDGSENASKEFDRQKIFDLIKEKEKEKWTFAFLGAGKDAYAEGGKMGIAVANTMHFEQKNIRGAMRRTGEATMAFAAGGQSSNGFFGKDNGGK